MANKFFKNKKGSEKENWAPTDFPVFIIYTVVLGLSAIFVVIFFTSVKSEGSTIKLDLESYFLMNRLFKSPQCMALYEESNGIMQNILDYSKFTDSQLDACFPALDQNDVAFKITLNSDELKIPDLPKSIKTKNWNDKINPAKNEAPRNILISYSGKTYNGEMSVEIQNIR